MAGDSTDIKVRLVDSRDEADMSVAVIGDQVVDLEGASADDVLTVQADGTVAPAPASVAEAGVTRPKLDSAAFKTARSAPTVVGTEVELVIPVAFAEPFADDAYTLAFSVERTAGTGGVTERRFQNKLAGSVDVVVENTSLLNSATVVVHVWAVHD